MRRPNVVLVLVDDMGYGDFGVFGDGSAETPALDRLVGEGVCLTQHYSGSAVCAPARAALMTGRYPLSDRALKYEPERFEDIVRVPEPKRTLPEAPLPELYNIEGDALEQHNLAQQEPGRTSRMLSDLEAWFEEVEAERKADERL